MTRLVLRIDGPHDSHSTKTVDAAAPIWIGRACECNVVLRSSEVSRKHLSLEVAGSQLRVRDASANGTRLGDSLLHGEARTCAAPVELGIGPFQVEAVIEDGRVADAARVLEIPGALRRRFHRLLMDRMDLGALDRSSMHAASLRPEVTRALERLCDELRDELPEGCSRTQLIAELSDEILGLGPLETLLHDVSVTEIMVVDAATIFTERAGRIERSPLRFTDDDAVRAVIERIVTPLGRRIDESAPLVDARLADGSRVNAVIPPLARRGPCITIRKFGGSPLSFDRLVELGSLDRRMATFLWRAVRARRNIVVAGGTGSGKTTLLNVLSTAVPDHERIVTIEDAAELRLGQPHVVALETKPPNLEGLGEISIRDLVRNALRMRPDRILVGECRGGEALDMLQAMNTGHEGSMTTTHANSPAEAVARLETLCLMAGVDLPLLAIRAQLASSIHLLVQQTRYPDGVRRVSSVSEVRGLGDRGDLELSDIFVFDRSEGAGHAGEFRSTGYVPHCLTLFATLGLLDGASAL